MSDSHVVTVPLSAKPTPLSKTGKMETWYRVWGDSPSSCTVDSEPVNTTWTQKNEPNPKYAAEQIHTITRWPFVIIIGAWALCVWFSPPVVSVPPHCGRQPCTAEQLWLDWSSAAWLLWSPGQRNAGQWDWGRWELGLLWELAVPLQAQHQSVNKVLNNNTVDTGTWKNEKWNGYFLWRRGLLSSDTECGPVLSPVYWAGGSHWRCRRSRPPALTLLASTRLHQHSSHLTHVYKDKLSQDTEAAGLNDCCHCRKTNQYFMLHAKNPYISEKGGLCSMTLTQ